MFLVGTESELCFEYVGLHLSGSGSQILFDQLANVASIAKIELQENNNDPNRLLTADERTKFRALVGQLNWVSGQSRPDISFDVCEASTALKSPTVKDILRANKIVNKLKGCDVRLLFHVVGNLSECVLHVFADASYGNLPGGGSQGGYIVFLSSSSGSVCPLIWQSHRIKRVVRSTLAAETLAMVEAAEAAILMGHLIAEINSGSSDGKHCNQIICHTDNKSLFDAACSTKVILDKRLRVDLAALREMCDRGEICLKWIPKAHQLSDVLTKKGATSNTLLHVLQKGKVSFSSCS